jgi:hypothetical protein
MLARPLPENQARLWRTLANAGPRGIGIGQLRDEVKPFLDAKPLRSALILLQGKGYAAFVGEGRSGLGLWTITALAPAGETLPEWKVSSADADDQGSDCEGDSDLTNTRGALATIPPVSSVFELGQRVQAEAAAPPGPMTMPVLRSTRAMAEKLFTVLRAAAPEGLRLIQIREHFADETDVTLFRAGLGLLVRQKRAEFRGTTSTGLWHSLDPDAAAVRAADAAPEAAPAAPTATAAVPRYWLSSDGAVRIEPGDGAEAIHLPSKIARGFLRWIAGISLGEFDAMVRQQT